MKIAASGGGVGDIIYSIPTLKKLDVGTIYIKESFYPDGSSMFSILKTFMECQGFRVLPTSGAFPHYVYEPGLQYDYDLDACKVDPHLRGVRHIMESYLVYYNLRYSGATMFDPWIVLPETENEEKEYTTWMVTERWREWSTMNWGEQYFKVPGRKIFIGIEADYKFFIRELSKIDANITLPEWFKTKDVLQVAKLIKHGAGHYCNQNFSLPLALGMGVEHYVEIKPRKTNCVSYKEYEHILNLQDQ